jgi:hypothetical protein
MIPTPERVFFRQYQDRAGWYLWFAMPDEGWRRYLRVKWIPA